MHLGRVHLDLGTGLIVAGRLIGLEWRRRGGSVAAGMGGVSVHDGGCWMIGYHLGIGVDLQWFIMVHECLCRFCACCFCEHKRANLRIRIVRGPARSVLRSSNTRL